MADRFDKFTERARKVLQHAQEEAQRFQHNYIGTEHLLLGLVREGDGVAAKVLRNLGVELNQVRSSVEFIIGRGDRTVAGDIGLTPRAKKVIELSVDEARRLHHHYVGTEHLLLGLTREGEGVAVGVLESHGVSLDRLRSQVISVLNSSAATTVDRPGSSTPALDRLSNDLTAAATAGLLFPFTGWNQEVERVITILGRLTGRNPTLLAQKGQSVARILEVVAQRMASANVPEKLSAKRLLEFDFASLIAEPSEDPAPVAQAIAAQDCVLVIHDVSRVLAAKHSRAALVSGVLRPALARGDLQIVGVCTPRDFDKLIKADGFLADHFEAVPVRERSVQETIATLAGMSERLERHHELRIDHDAFVAAAELAARHVPDGFMPDKAIRLIDETAARVNLLHSPPPPRLHELRQSLDALRRAKESAIAEQQYDRAAQIRDREAGLLAEIEQLQQAWKADRAARDLPLVTRQDVAEVVSTWTGLSLDQLL